jgi:hypothetical protein
VARKITPWEEWKSQIDWDKVRDNILDVGEKNHELTTIDFELSAGMVFDAAQHFVPLDMAGLQVVGIEKSGVFGPDNTKYVIDVLFSTRKDGIAPYNQYPEGTLLVADWKSAQGNLDQNWRTKYIRSWQARMYAAATEALLVEYRGISQVQDPDDPVQGSHQTKAVLVEMPATNTAEVMEFLYGVQQQVNSLALLEVYPRNMPKSCGMYGRNCEFRQDCETNTMPRQRLEGNQQLSFSRIQHFFECPEKYRRLKLQRDDSGNVTIGLAVHRGLANIYSQISGVPVEERK